MPDELFEDHYLASPYDGVCADRHDEAFYLQLASSAERVLDIGCGTGTLLHRARAAGHRGRLVGLDPAAGMLARARRRDDIEWRHGYLPDAGFDAEFDLAFMTGHAFQVLLTDAEILELLVGVHRALRPGGRFAFETRNPLHRAWEQWTPDAAVETTDDAGTPIRVFGEVLAVDGELVTFTQTFAAVDRDEARTSRSTLRFVPAEHLDALLTRAGFVVDERYGDWDRSLFTPASREIITIASTH